MDLEKIYYDIDCDKCNILDLVKCNPEWAANRIQEGEKAIEQLESRPKDINEIECWCCHKKYGKGHICSTCGREGR